MATRNPIHTRETAVMAAHTVNTGCVLLIPTMVVWFTHPGPVYGSGLLFATVILFMKLVSYAHVNYDYRLAARESAQEGMTQISAIIAKYTNTVEDTEGLVRYPYNITLRNLYYFWMAPTLTYQLNFPRCARIRWWLVGSLSLRIFVVGSLIFFLGQQHVVPIIEKATDPISRLDMIGIFERLLKLTIPMTYIWLLMFYLFFHLFLNLIGELLRFGDRIFYKDWWNATTFEEYWRLWNLPVHYWMVRHLYFPLLRAGLGRSQAMLLVFTFSAVFHELLVSVPFHMLRFYAFGAMLGQIPLVGITKKLDQVPLWKNLSGGNILFWATFCFIGQPMAVLLYYYDWKVLNQPSNDHTCSNTGVCSSGIMAE